MSKDGARGDVCVQACLKVIEYLRYLNPQLFFFVGNLLHGSFLLLDCVRRFIERGEYRHLNRHLQYYIPDTHTNLPTLVSPTASPGSPS